MLAFSIDSRSSADVVALEFDGECSSLTCSVLVADDAFSVKFVDADADICLDLETVDGKDAGVSIDVSCYVIGANQN